jgi:hypothetical protein
MDQGASIYLNAIGLVPISFYCGGYRRGKALLPSILRGIENVFIF